jgi:hypothetical protein
MFIDVGTDTIVKIHESLCLEEVIVHSRVFGPLIEYFNESLKQIGKRYKCVYSGITKDYRFDHNYEKYLKTLKQ